MKEIQEQLNELGRRLTAAEEVLKLEERRREISELTGETTAENFWQDRAKAERIMRDIAAKKRFIAPWEKIESGLKDLADLLSATAPADRKTQGEIARELASLTDSLDKNEFALLMTGEYDSSDAILSVYAGAGGTDAADWAEILLRMFLRFAERQGFSLEILHISSTDEAGVKSVTARVSGPFAYGWLKSESGVHRLVRLSPFDADHARHTSFALVDVIPEVGEEIELEIKPEDLKIDVFRASGHGGQSVNTTDSAVRITHLPTGITVSVQNERSQLQNKNTAMKILKTRLFKLLKEHHAEKIDEIRGTKVSAEWGNQIRSYVLHPYTKVKDHRTGYETGDTQKVLDGDLVPFIESYLRKTA